jgi:hypothetical protein
LFAQGPSEHLSWTELACRDGTPYPLEWRNDRARPLALEFEAIRYIVGGPIPINSAFRTLAYNRRVPSKDTSQHVEAKALDLGHSAALGRKSARAKRWVRERLLPAVIEVSKRPRSRIKGIGVYPFFIHIDIRHGVGSRIARWNGTRIGADSQESA